MNRNNIQSKLYAARAAFRSRMAAATAVAAGALVPAFAMAQAGPGAALTADLGSARADVLAVIILLAGILALIVAWRKISQASKS